MYAFCSIFVGLFAVAWEDLVPDTDWASHGMPPDGGNEAVNGVPCDGPFAVAREELSKKPRRQRKALPTRSAR